MATILHTMDDIRKVRPDIANYGMADFTEQMEEAEKKLFRAVESKWYRSVANAKVVDWRENTFNPERLGDPSQLKDAAVYKSLQLIYLYLQKDSPEPDGFERNSKNFQKLYFQELDELLSHGIDYDWDDDGEISADEYSNSELRRLYRV